MTSIVTEVKRAADHAAKMAKANLHSWGLSIHIAAQRYGVNRTLVARELNNRRRFKTPPRTSQGVLNL